MIISLSYLVIWEIGDKDNGTKVMANSTGGGRDSMSRTMLEVAVGGFRLGTLVADRNGVGNKVFK